MFPARSEPLPRSRGGRKGVSRKLPEHLDREESQDAHADVFKAQCWVLAEIRHLRESRVLTFKSESGWRWLKIEPPPGWPTLFQTVPIYTWLCFPHSISFNPDDNPMGGRECRFYDSPQSEAQGGHVFGLGSSSEWQCQA